MSRFLPISPYCGDLRVAPVTIAADWFAQSVGEPPQKCFLVEALVVSLKERLTYEQM